MVANGRQRLSTVADLRSQHLDGKEDLALVFGELGERVHRLSLRVLAKLVSLSKCSLLQ